jgi:hypothetical protein
MGIRKNQKQPEHDEPYHSFRKPSAILAFKHWPDPPHHIGKGRTVTRTPPFVHAEAKIT